MARHGEAGQRAAAAIELELRELLGAMLEPGERVAFVDRGAFALGLRRAVDPVLREVCARWRDKGPISLGALELERTVRVASLDRVAADRLAVDAQRLVAELRAGATAHDLPMPVAIHVDAAARAATASERAASLVRAVEGLWHVLGCALIASFWSMRRAAPIGVAGAAEAWPRPWRGAVPWVAAELATGSGRIGELAEAVRAATSDGARPLLVASDLASAVTATLALGAIGDDDVEALARAVEASLLALAPLRGWTLVAVVDVDPLDLDGAVSQIECIDFSGPHASGTLRRQTIAGLRVLPFVYLARWAEGVAIPLEPLVRLVRVPVAPGDQLVVVEDLPRAAGRHAYRQASRRGRVELDVTVRQLAR